MNQYEAMFIFDSTYAAEFGNVETEINRLMERAEGEIIVSKKWEDRRLAYEMKKRKRGCYVLTFFRANPDRIVGIERDVALSENILRVMILRADGMSRERMEACYPAKAADKPSGEGTAPTATRAATAEAAPESAVTAAVATATVEAPAAETDAPPPEANAPAPAPDAPAPEADAPAAEAETKDAPPTE